MGEFPVTVTVKILVEGDFSFLLPFFIFLKVSTWIKLHRPSAMQALSVWSLNANGLQSPQKRRAIFKKCRTGGHDFILLQETHSTPAIAKLWQTEWGGSIIYSHGESNARGVAILIPRNSCFNIVHQTCDNQGRFIILHVEREGHSFVLGNIYAPTQDHPQEQIQMINNLEDELIASGAVDIILGGDFNICMTPSLDRTHRANEGQAGRTSGYREKLLALSEGLHLADAWRSLNPGIQRFTFRRGLYASRLDLWLISEHLIDSRAQSNIITEPLSDHAAIDLRIGIQDTPRGPGSWRFDNILLNDNKLILKLKETINQEKNSPDPMDPRSKWDWIKHRIKEEASKFAKNKRTQEKQHEKGLRDRLLKNTAELDEGSEYEEDLVYEMDSIKREIKEMELAQANATILRAAGVWALQGERPTKYFLNLEKIRSKNKAISELINEHGKVIRDRKEILEEERSFFQSLYCRNDESEVLSSLEQLNLERDSVPRISAQDQERLEGEYSAEEFRRALGKPQQRKMSGFGRTHG